MLRTIRGVVIKEIPFKESSKILNILTCDGIVGVVSKGCKNIKSNLRNISGKLIYADFIIYYNEDKLSTLKDGTEINHFNNIRSDLTLISYMAYLTELTAQVIKQDNNKDIFDIYINTLLKIENGFNPLVMSNILEIKLLDYLGAPINFNSCIKCGNSKDIITFSADEGGYICSSCHKDELIYDNKVLKMLKLYYYVDINTISDLNISEKTINDINDIISAYYDRFTGVYIHSKEFLKKLK
ncbi:MAG TPA: DNA repair protein RecO [Bacilli bacterium]|nr:DNA repair protein RecO [Bacilli bacterium]HPZ23782.1 DNA repair protein RecO [Bacilli bacterium]HQC84045.1 DNA repair protein RecO [Bacilli bacterium]